MVHVVQVLIVALDTLYNVPCLINCVIIMKGHTHSVDLAGSTQQQLNVKLEKKTFAHNSNRQLIHVQHIMHIERLLRNVTCIYNCIKTKYNDVE